MFFDYINNSNYNIIYSIKLLNYKKSKKYFLCKIFKKHVLYNTKKIFYLFDIKMNK